MSQSVALGSHAWCTCHMPLAVCYGMQPKNRLYACHPPLGKVLLQDSCTSDPSAQWATVMISLVTALESSDYPRDGNHICNLIRSSHHNGVDSLGRYAVTLSRSSPAVCIPYLRFKSSFAHLDGE